MVLATAIIAFLILLTALYVAAEFAAVGARRSRLRRLAEDGNPLAARILPVVEDPHELDRYIAASQVGITLSSLILGAYAQASIAPRVAPLLAQLGWLQPATAQSTAAVLVLLVLTTLAMIVGELVPKSLALQNPTRTALVTVLPMQWSLRLFSWSIKFLNGSGILILKLLGVPSTGHRHVHSPEEIELLIAESRDGGLLEPQEQVRLHRALRLGLRSARELMVPRTRLAAIEVDTPFDEVLRVVADSPYSRLPVYRGALDDVLGILHTKDVVTDFIANRHERSITAVLKPIVRVAGDMPADRLLAFLRERRSHQALVTDEHGRIVGLITVEDVLTELLGGISDEFKTHQAQAVRLSNGRLRLPGGMRVEHAAQALGVAWSAPGETIGAYIAARAGRALEQGDRLEIDGAAIEIESLEAGLIVSLIVAPRVETEQPR
jgi:CBS domain containing-hemolysin-like protein